HAGDIDIVFHREGDAVEGPARRSPRFRNGLVFLNHRDPVRTDALRPYAGINFVRDLLRRCLAGGIETLEVGDVERDRHALPSAMITSAWPSCTGRPSAQRTSCTRPFDGAQTAI